MSVFVGFDTSNYTTSVAVYDDEKNIMISRKKLLPVEDGEKGLMQSKALFCHIRQLPEVMEAAFSSLSEFEIKGVGVSNKPRNTDGSYMPVFLAGVSAAAAVAASHKIPLFKTSHQIGHIIAALYNSNRMDLINQRFIAFHVSGGTTEALLVTPDDEHILNCEIVAKSLDLKAGQAIDRVGVMLGLSFPAGAELDRLSQNGVCPEFPKPILKGNNCCISGLENKCISMLEKGEKPENISRFAIEFICQVIEKMTSGLKRDYGDIPFLYVGGVMSNSIIKKRISDIGGIFCDSQFSSDNATGIAVSAAIKYKMRCEHGK